MRGKAAEAWWHKQPALLPVIIAGGRGQRLWPLSTPEHPKPFVDVLGDGISLFQRTLARAQALSDLKPLVVCNSIHAAFFTEAHVDLLLEPVQRDTAPAICAAALQAMKLHGQDITLVIMPADHLVRDTSGFVETVRKAGHVAQQDTIVTIAIPPTRPATEFGYLDLKQEQHGFHEVAAFVEKPDASRAVELVASDHHWNGGLFVARAAALIDAFEAHAPSILNHCRHAVATEPDQQLDESEFSKCQAISFDFAIMEKHRAIAAVKAGFDWDDLGNWGAVYRAMQKNVVGNVLRGNIQCTDCCGLYVHSQNLLVAATDCSDLVIVCHGEHCLIANLHLCATLRDPDKLETISLGPQQEYEMILPWCAGTIRVANPSSTQVRLKLLI
jgi:mannose-1-phosphate guanylyltransferase / mannose-6-phosphate isomerase